MPLFLLHCEAFPYWHSPFLRRVERPGTNLPSPLLDKNKEIEVHPPPAPLDIGDEVVILSVKQKTFFSIRTHPVARFLKMHSQRIIRVLVLGMDIISVLATDWQFFSGHFQTLLWMNYFPRDDCTFYSGFCPIVCLVIPKEKSSA